MTLSISSQAYCQQSQSKPRCPAQASITAAPQVNQQLASPIFGKLPAELRFIILSELFGERRVHLAFMPHPTRSDKVGNMRRWRHGLCEEPVSTPLRRLVSRPHFCLSSARHRVLDVAFMFTCRRALMESIPILYQSNCFFISNTGNKRLPVDDIRSLQAKMPKHWPLIKSLDIEWVCSYDRNHASMVPHLRGRESYEDFWDALAEMPSLTKLRIALIVPWYSCMDHHAPSPAEMQELYLGPMTRPRNLEVCEVLMHSSLAPFLGLQQIEWLRKQEPRCQYRISWIDEMPGQEPRGPAAAVLPHLLGMFGPR